MSTSKHEPAQTQATMPPERLAEIQGRVLNATPGPWDLYPEYGPNFYANVRGEMLLPVGSVEFGEGENADADRALVEHAAEDLAALLQQVDRQAREVERLTAELAKYVGKEPTLAEEAQYRHEAQVRYAAALEASICQCEPQCEGGEYLHAADCPVVPIQMQAFDAAGGAR